MTSYKVFNGTEIPENCYYDLVSAVRGPDMPRGAWGAESMIYMTLKSVGSLYARAAVFGWEAAKGYSNPGRPYVEGMLKLTREEILTVSTHYRLHMHSALGVILSFKLLEPQHLEDITKIQERLFSNV